MIELCGKCGGAAGECVCELDGVKPLHESPSFELVVDNTGKYCRHGQRLVDDKQRRVECGTCGAVLDPFDALQDIAKEHERWGIRLRLLQNEAKRAQERLNELKRIERNAVSRLRRKGVKVDDYYRRDTAAALALADKKEVDSKPRRVR